MSTISSMHRSQLNLYRKHVKSDISLILMIIEMIFISNLQMLVMSGISFSCYEMSCLGLGFVFVVCYHPNDVSSLTLLKTYPIASKALKSGGLVHLLTY